MSLKFGILGLLNQATMTGYNLKKQFDRTLNNVWNASLSQIYRELGNLEDKGFVSSVVEEQADRPDKKIYSISESGKEAFADWLGTSPQAFVSPKRDEFMLRMFFGPAMGREEARRQLCQFLADRAAAADAFSAEMAKLPEYLAALPQSADPREEELYLRFILRRAERTNALLLDWARECMEELDQFEIESLRR